VNPEPFIPPPSTPDTAPDTAPPFVPPVEPKPEPEPEAAAESVGDEYRFIYRDTTIYPELGLTVEPGDIHEWPDGPPNDGRWTPATPKE
jgi:hypothetical protein